MISVALAAYKGEKYIEEQLRSILSQLDPGDEVIVSDDAPGGATEAVVRTIAATDARVKYIAGPGQGVIANFNNAISATQGDYIFLADQDDVWLPGKVEKCVAALAETPYDPAVVLHNAKVVDASLNVMDPSFFASHGSRPGYWENLLKNSYMGCCMAFTSSLKPYILPLPLNAPMHDQYIGLQAEKVGNVTFIDEPLLLYRQHGNNVTGRKTSLKEKITWRTDILKLTFDPTVPVIGTKSVSELNKQFLHEELLAEALADNDADAFETDDCSSEAIPLTTGEFNIGLIQKALSKKSACATDATCAEPVASKTSTNGKKVSACIVTYNNERCIEEAVRTLLDCTKRDDLTLYIVDNGSTDGTLDILKSNFASDPRFVLLETGMNAGFGAGHNKVLEFLDSDYHCVVNPDVIIKDDVIADMVDYAEAHPEAVQLSPRIKFPDGRDQILGKRYPHVFYIFASHFRSGDEPGKVLSWYARLPQVKKGKPFNIQNATGCFMFFRTDAFKRVGGFDDRYFMYFEDCDITRQMGKLGKVKFLPDTTIYHAWERGSKTNKKLKLIHIQSMLKFYWKWKMI